LSLCFCKHNKFDERKEKNCTTPAVLLRPTSGLVFASTLCSVVRLVLMHSLFCGLMAGCQTPPPARLPLYTLSHCLIHQYVNMYRNCNPTEHGDSALLSNVTSLILCEISCTAPAVYVARREVERESLQNNLTEIEKCLFNDAINY